MLNRRQIEDIYPMSDIEKGMVYHYLKDAAHFLYHNQMPIQFIERNLDPGRLHKAFSLLTDKHHILRTGFNIEDFEEPVQIVYKDIKPDIFHFDISHLDKREQEDYIALLLEEDRQKPFDVRTPPLWRLKTIKIDNGNICLLWITHHAIIDGWSTSLLMTELHHTYNRLKQDPDYVPQKLKSSYKDFIIQQRSEMKNLEVIDFWKGELKNYQRFDFSPVKRDVQTEDRIETYDYDMGSQILHDLKLTARHLHTSVKHLCFGAYVYMLYMMSYQRDFIVGVVANNRPICEDGDKIIGCFLNTVPVRIQLTDPMPVREFIRSLDAHMENLQRYGRIPLPEIVKHIGDKSRGKNPLFDTHFNFVDFYLYSKKIHSNQDHESVHKQEFLEVPGRGETNSLFECIVNITGKEVRLHILYHISLFDETGILKWCGYFKRILNKFTREPDALLSKRDILFPEEKQRLLYEFNRCDGGYTGLEPIHGIFERQAGVSPDRAALAAHDGCLTYGELNRQANRAARLLRKESAAAGHVVGLMVGRSLASIIGILGILKSGRAYLPISPHTPGERLNFMLRDSGIKLILASGTALVHGRIGPGAFETTIIELEEDKRWHQVPPKNPRNINSPGDLAYLIYTSGSTGKPKGVLIEHRGVGNLVYGLHETIYSKYVGVLNVSMVAPFEFDASVQQIFGALLQGHTLFIVPGETRRDGKGLLHYYNRNAIDISDGTPTHLRMMVESIPGKFTRLKVKHFIIAGEELPGSLVEKFYQKLTTSLCNISNFYGPTETCVDSTFFHISPNDLPMMNSIPIGKPLAHEYVFITDNCCQWLQPVGVGGELLIGGDGLARGYLNRPELTAEKFDHDLWDYRDYQDEKALFERIKNASSEEDAHQLHKLTPIETTSNKKLLRGVQGGGFLEKSPPGRRRQRVYKTGDLARWLPDGSLQFLGRCDYQVKIMGIRIELGEIENLLLQYPGITDVVVIAIENIPGSKRLAAYYTSSKGAATEQLREFLSGKLPVYMIPSHFNRIGEIPRTLSGKVDRQALPLPDPAIKTKGANNPPPVNEIQRLLVDVFSEVLGAPVGTTDDFFQIGGNSLLSIRIVKKLKKYNLTLNLRDLLMHPTIEKIASILDPSASRQPLPGVVKNIIALNQDYHHKSKNIFFIHPQRGGIGPYKPLANALKNYNFYGIQARGLFDDEEPAKSWEDMTDQYFKGIQTIQKHSPYILSGYSLGGLIAYEIAYLLELHSQKIEKLILIDSPPFNPRFGLDVEKEIETELKDAIGKWVPAGQPMDLKSENRILEEIAANENFMDSPEYMDLEHLKKLVEVTRNNMHVFNCLNQRKRDGLLAADIYYLKTPGNAGEQFPDKKWQDYTRGSVFTIEIPGEHTTLLSPPYIYRLIEEVKKILLLI